MSARIELGRKIARQQRVAMMGERVEVAIDDARQQRDAVRYEAMQAEAAQPEPVQPEPVQRETVHPEPVQPEAAHPEEVQAEAVQVPAPRVEPKPPPQRTIVHEEPHRQDVSQATLRRNHIIAGLRDDMRADAFRVLRVKVLQKMREKGWSSLGITSAAPGDGKTLMAVNLALCVAMDMNQTVTLVDVDLRRPSVHKTLGLNPTVGLSDYLMDQCSLEDCLVDPGIERLQVLPQLESLRNSSEILAMPKSKGLMKRLKGRNQDRLVIYDMPPLLASDDALVVLPYLDTTILVVQEGKSEVTEIERALDLLRDRNLLGTVLNRSEPTDRYYY